MQQIEKLNPGLVFLDIEMPGLNGFELLSRLAKPPKVIFTTAYDQYAVKAFEEESIDIDAEEKYVFLNTVDGKRSLTDFTITALAEKLPDQFVRINRSTIINSDLIKEIKRGFNGAFFFIMNDAESTKLNSSRSFGPVLKDIFDI